MINQAKKMNLDDLKIESFVTTNDSNHATIKGGNTWGCSYNNTLCISTVPRQDGCHPEEPI